MSAEQNLDKAFNDFLDAFEHMRSVHREHPDARIAALSAENERLRKALEWALDHATDSDHPHYPARSEHWPWVYSYLVSGTPLGGGVGEAGFSSALEAVESAMVGPKP